MDSYGETQTTGKFGYFQARGGYRAMSGMQGRHFRTKGATNREIRESANAKVKPRNVPEDEYTTTAKASVEKQQHTQAPEGINDPVVADG
jgi:hypothetical protein